MNPYKIGVRFCRFSTGMHDRTRLPEVAGYSFAGDII